MQCTDLYTLALFHINSYQYVMLYNAAKSGYHLLQDFMLNFLPAYYAFEHYSKSYLLCPKLATAIMP